MSATVGDEPQTPSADPLGPGKKAADSGDTLPFDGNLLPLLAFLLNTLPPQAAQPSASTSSATEGEASQSSAAVSGQPSAQDLLRQLAAALQLEQTSGEGVQLEGEGGDVLKGPALTAFDAQLRGSTPLPAALLRELMQAQSGQSSIGAGTNELPQALKDAIASLVASGQFGDKKGVGAANIAASGTASQVRAALTNATAATTGSLQAAPSPSLPGIDAQNGLSNPGSVLRQLLSSLADPDASADIVDAAVRRSGNFPQAANAAVPAAPASVIDTLAARLDVATANLNGAQIQAAAATNTETRQLLREIGFDRAFEASPSQSSSVVPSHGLAAQPNGTTATNDVPVLQLNARMNTPEWADGLGDRIVWLTDQNLSNAQIRLNPPHLGPIEVSVSVTDDQTNVSFMAHHAATRDALEAAAPRLREVLGSQGGLGTINVNINQQSSSERSAQGQRYDAWQSFDPPPFETASTAGAIRPSARTLIDTYA